MSTEAEENKPVETVSLFKYQNFSNTLTSVYSANNFKVYQEIYNTI